MMEGFSSCSAFRICKHAGKIVRATSVRDRILSIMIINSNTSTTIDVCVSLCVLVFVCKGLCLLQRTIPLFTFVDTTR